MRLFIASSHSLALAIAGNLPGIRQGTDDCIEVGDDVVTWCDGRLLKLCEPDSYDSRWAKWDVTTPPIKLPYEKWQLTPQNDPVMKKRRQQSKHS